jgi:cellulose synthase/poly-beta-1,6-N-acetylglucosamine synthase-like glycosyltransferase
MHHRNERNAIIQHGTMTLVRREPLERTGGWAEWCICEDAELGLRLMHDGKETRYLDEVVGRGLTPADFAAYKSQRYRWAFGAMQILKRHFGWLVKPGPLTAGQRFHFLTGWFSWFADALHLVFTIMALFWTLGMVTYRDIFTLPLGLFLFPVLGFFVAKAVFGIVLYLVRVPCSWRDTLGAALASMALSHSIALGIFKGLAAKKGEFVRTAKSRRMRKQPSAWLIVREESLIFIALMLAIAAMVHVWGLNFLETRLWVCILIAQSLPYLSAMISASIAARSGEVSG